MTFDSEQYYMMKNHKVMVDPPSGDKYGFPKLIPLEELSNIEDWLMDNGYPEKEIDEHIKRSFFDMLVDDRDVLARKIPFKEILEKKIYLTYPFKSGFIHVDRWEVLTAYIKAFDFKTGCELGVSEGETLFNLLNENEDLFMYGVDIWELQDDNKLETYEHENSLKKRKEIVFDELQKYSSRVKIYEERTDEAHAHFEDESLDFIFIDADHTYETVKRDIELWAPKVQKEGIIFGHDLNWGDVARAVGEMFTDFYINGDNVWSAVKQSLRS